jgi:hypothetical protein
MAAHAGHLLLFSLLLLPSVRDEFEQALLRRCLTVGERPRESPRTGAFGARNSRFALHPPWFPADSENLGSRHSRASSRNSGTAMAVNELTGSERHWFRVNERIYFGAALSVPG